MNDPRTPAATAVSLEQLLELHDEAFVTQAYQSILGRMPDPGGLANYLKQVRAGVHKAQIVAELAQSSEGKLRSVEPPGLRYAVAKYRKRAPTLGRRLLQQMMNAAMEPLERHLRAIDNQLYLLEQSQSAQAKQLADLLALIQNRMPDLGGSSSSSPNSANDAIHAPPLSHHSPNLGQLFTELKAAIAMKRGIT